MKNVKCSSGRQTEPEDGAVRHSYTSSLRLQFAELVKKFVLSAGIMMLPAALLLSLDTGWSVGTILIVCMMPGAVFAVYWAFWQCHIRIEADADGVHFYRGKRQYRSFALEADFAPAVVKKKLNGIFYGTNREFRLPYAKNRYKTVSCHCITGKDFSNLIEDINILRNGGSLSMEQAAGGGKNAWRTDTFPEAFYRPGDTNCRDFDFHLPRRRMIARERKRLLPLALTQAGILLVLAGAGIGGFFRIPVRQPQVLVFAAFVPALLAVLFSFASWGRYAGFVRKLPERIVLTDSGIKIDERLFPASQLREIAMTPPGYGETRNGYSILRRLRLSAASGNREYHLGCTRAAPQELVYEEYERLLAALRDWCGVHRVPFREESE